MLLPSLGTHAVQHKIIIGLAALFMASPLMAQDQERLLFSFETPAAAQQWQTVNDGVMGGRSNGRFKISNEQRMEFYGTLSLENNGGFASVRSRPTAMNLQPGDSIVVRVRGDGRQYSMNLYVPSRQMAFAYRAFFNTDKQQWIEVTIPLADFQATSFGRTVNQPLNPAEVNGFGFLLGDKQAGPFKLEVEWVKVVH
jgi:monofunctional biosynthetic peptidoglycan transglycosylase